MADDKKKPEDDGANEKKSKWSTGAKVGAAVGSAAVAAALIYAGRHKMRKLDEFKASEPKPGTRYENEPVDGSEEDEE
ncbi:hypothetical protein [Sphingorhabdus sp. Alg231-15]|uniref:hypothetical protein n=1 Tax=Sphingorhabdus sp. Alg231-15 TaxID=1922222 RepID=UPI000D55F325